jgi:hypothetical protein
MPTFRHGKNTKVFIDEYDLSNQLREANVSGEADTAETSAFGTQDKTYVVGLIGSNASLSGMFSGAAGEDDALFNSWNADDLDHVTTICHEGTGAAGTGVGRRASILPGKFYSRSVTNSLTDMVGIQAMVQSDGPARTGLLLHDYATAETATGNTTGQDNGAATAFGGAAHLHVPINSRNGTLIAKVQHSTDNSAWSDLITFTTINASTVGKERISLAAGTTVNRYVRGQWTIAGTTGSVSFLIAFARYTF